MQDETCFDRGKARPEPTGSELDQCLHTASTKYAMQDVAAQPYFASAPLAGPGPACLHHRCPCLSAAGAVLPPRLSHLTLQCQGGDTPVQDVHGACHSGGECVCPSAGGNWAARRVGTNLVSQTFSRNLCLNFCEVRKRDPPQLCSNACLHHGFSQCLHHDMPYTAGVLSLS
jgi:hypothetical protein